MPLTKPHQSSKPKRKNSQKGLFDHLVSEKKGLFDHLKKEGKDEEWNRVREELKILFREAGIISCELQLKGCTRAYNFGWTWNFCHSKKRGDISTDPEKRESEIREVVYGCQNCHGIIEPLKRDAKPNMYEIVTDRINKRKIQPKFLPKPIDNTKEID